MSEIGRQTPFGFVLFCDDIRQEQGGKVTLVGMYGPNMLFDAPFPITVPKLGIVVKYFERPAESTDPLQLVIFMPGDEDEKPSIVADVPRQQLRSLPGKPESNQDELRWMATMNLVLSPITFTTLGRMKVRMRRGSDIINLGSLRIETSAEAQPITPKS